MAYDPTISDPINDRRVYHDDGKPGLTADWFLRPFRQERPTVKVPTLSMEDLVRVSFEVTP